MDSPVTLATRPLTPTFGVEILGVDVTKADAATLEAITQALFEQGVIVLKNQTLDAADQVRFTELFGQPEDNARKEYTVPGQPKVYVISNKIVDGKKIGEPNAGLNWHTDFTYAIRPALCTILHAIEAPAEGSDTLVADLAAAWEALPEERRQAVRGKMIEHSFAYLAEQRGRPTTHEHGDTIPDSVNHPMVRKLPENGRESLWISYGTARRVVDMPNPEGQDLIHQLIQFSTQEQFVYRHKWERGDLLMWDNRRSLHTGTPFDADKYIRHVHRTWVRGEAPVPA
jgi:taurine dioxygenase